MILPMLISNVFRMLIKSDTIMAILEGCIRIGIFVTYIKLISRMEDIKRTFMYHGSEHKCINCLEHGLELNVENVEFIDDARAFTTYQIKPQLRTLGRRYGKLVPAIGEYLKGVDGNAFVDALERDGAVKFEINGAEVALENDDCLISPAQKPGFVAETERDTTVVIDTNLTPELIEKGFVREVISKLQTMRKEAGFDVVDRITVAYRASDALAPVIAKNADAIASAVLATAIDEGDAPADAYQRDWSINGEKATLSVRKNG